MSRRLSALAASIFAMFWGQAATCAEITHESSSNGTGVIAIQGEISARDAVTFREIALRYRRAVVGLESNGGELLPAIEIGKLIQLAGFDTVVPSRAVCASSCALIWLAGERRLLASDGQVGFHASYRAKNGRLEESGVANALIGSYLTSLGLPRSAIIFATTAPPDEILWLTAANKRMAAIDFETIGGTSPDRDVAAQSVTPPPIQTQPVRNTSALPSYLPQSLSQSGERWVRFAKDGFYDANSVRKVKDIDGNPAGREFWTLIDYNGLEKTKLRYSLVRYFIYCPRQTQAFYEWIDYANDGQSKTKEVSSRPTSILPGSLAKVLANTLCS